MNLENLHKAESVAKEFIKLCKESREAAQEDDFFWYGCRKSGNLRRKSMDLSNALVDLRKPSY